MSGLKKLLDWWDKDEDDDDITTVEQVINKARQFLAEEQPTPTAEHPDLVAGTMPYAPKDERYCGIKYMVDILKKQIIKTDHDDLSEFGEGCIFFLKDMLDNAEMFYKEEKKRRHVKVEKEIDK